MTDKVKHYCYQCGSLLEKRPLDGRWREVCSNCGWIHYRQLKVGAAALIEQNERLLLLRRACDPWKDAWNLPAGYVEADEDPARGAERETFEETGLRVKAGELLYAHYFNDDPRGNGVLLVYRCEIVSGSIMNSPEVAEFAFFHPHEIPDHLAGAGHTRTIQDWRRNRRSGPNHKRLRPPGGRCQG